MAHTHDIYDDDTYFSIDPESKAIINDSNSKPVLIKGAHNSERYTFEMPREVEGHDMTLCNRVEIHYIVVGATKQVADVYLVKDFKPDPEDENNLIFTWLISKAVTGVAGALSFVITFKCLNGDVLDYAWPTDIYTGIKVLDTIDNGDVVEREDYKDVLETWRQSVLGELEKMLDEKVRAELKETLCDKTEILDVDVLPTENIQEGCIYRIRKAHGAYYLKDDSDVTPWEATARGTIHYVDTLPEVGIKHEIGGSLETSAFHFYKKKGDNEWFYYQSDAGTWWGDPYAIFESIEEAKNNGFGFAPESTECKIYAIDNSNPFGAGWVELTGGGSVISVASLPESDIDTESIYRIGDFATVYFKNADGSISTNLFNDIPVKVYIVDELPTAGEYFTDNTNAPTRGVAYYCKADKELYLYMGAWAKFSDEIGAWQEVDSIDGVTTEGIAYVCLNANKGLFYYDGEWHELVDKAELEGALKSIDSIGFNNKAGGKGYKVTGIVLADDTIITQTSSSNSSSAVVGYELRTTEGLQVGFTYSVRLGSAAYNVGEITSISGNRILVSNAPQIKSFNTNADNLKSGFVANVLTIKGHPELGDVEVGFNAFSTGSGNYVAERNGFSSGSGNHVLGCNGAAFGQGNIAGYDALVWGKGNRALADQSAVGGKYADQSSNALFTLGNGYVDDTGEHRRNAFEVRLDGTTTVGLPKDATDAINVQMLRFYLGLDAIDTWTGFTISLHANGTASISDGADASSEVIIPGAYRGYLVQDIAKGCFQNNLEISDVNIQEGVQTIYANAFQNCKSLSKVQLPNTLVKIDYGAFQNTALSSINLPESLKSIHLNAFRNAPLTCTISIPKSCRYIGYNHDGSGADTGYVFSSKSIPAIVFEGIPIKISPNAFKGCICNIHVPWSEGEVEGAPWGTSGTVYYNSNGYADTKKYVDALVAELQAQIDALKQ